MIDPLENFYIQKTFTQEGNYLVDIIYDNKEFFSLHCKDLGYCIYISNSD